MSVDTSSKDYQHKEFPKQFKKDEFWRQIKRTVNGVQVSEQDIAAIVRQILQHLNLQPTDHLLDLGCGNGALASRLFAKIQNYTGVDFSDALLEIAQEFFEPHDGIQYINSDIREIENYAQTAGTADKVLIYGCIAYLEKNETESLLRNLRSQFHNLKRVFIGNVPNQTYADKFFASRSVVDFELDNPQSPIGVWWSADEFVQLGNELGFQAECHFMPDEFYGSPYRFDILLNTN